MTTGEGADTRGNLPAMIAGATVLAAWLILLSLYDTPIGSAVLFLAFLAFYVYLPGWLLYRVLMRDPGGWIRQIALGGALGYLLSILAFMFTAAIDVRTLLDFYPLIVGIPAAVLLGLRYRKDGLPSASDAVPAGLAWAIGAVGILAMIYVGVPFFAATPLPGVDAVRYSQDYTWAISLAADFLHHWPVMEAAEVGESVPYHYFVHIHVASATQVTGTELPIVFLRLWILPVTVLAVIQLVEAGRSLFGSSVVGLIAAFLAFLVGEAGIALGGIFISFVILSPSFVFGLIFLLPLFTVVGERLRRNSFTEDRGSWVLLTAFAIGAGGAKVTVLPLLIGSLAIFGLWSWFKSRRFPVNVLAVGVVFAAVQFAYYLLLYQGHTSGLAFNPSSGIDFLRSISASELVKDDLLDLLPDLPGLDGLLTVLAVPLTLIAVLGPPLIGLVWLFNRSNRPLSSVTRWLGCVLFVGLVFLTFVEAVGTNNQLYFAYYGVLAGVLLSAAGIQVAYRDRQSVLEHRKGVLLLLGLWAGVLIALTVLVFINPKTVDADQFARNTLIAYSTILFGLITIGLLAHFTLKGSRQAVTLVVAAAFVMVGMTTVPKLYVKPSLDTHSAPVTGYRVTPGLLGALRWLRSETSVDDIFIVNNQEAESITGYATAYDYTAFSERRAFLAGWGYSISTRDAGYDRVRAGFNPFADRQTLNDRAFSGDEAAIETLKDDWGVRYALVDGINGDPTNLEALRPFGQVVYETPDATVVALGPPDDPG